MTGIATVVCLVLALLTALFAGIQALRDRPVTDALLAAAGATELAVLVYVGLRVADLLGGHLTDSLPVVLAYLAGMAVTTPIAAALSLGEPSRWGCVVLAVGALVTCVLFLRIDQLWTPYA